MAAINCPQCGRVLKYGDEHAGRRASCKSCGEKFVLPGDDLLFEDDPPPKFSAMQSPPAETRIQHRTKGSAGTGFGVGFGGCLGVTFAMLLIFGVVCALLIKACDSVSTARNELRKDPAGDPTIKDEKQNGDRNVQPRKLTKAMYDRIEAGMTIGEVEKIIGWPGEELARNDIGGFQNVVLSWKNPTGSNMNATFQNGKLVQKAQFGLR